VDYAAARVVHGQGPVRRPLRRALHTGHGLIILAGQKFLIVPASFKAISIDWLHCWTPRSLRLLEVETVSGMPSRATRRRGTGSFRISAIGFVGIDPFPASTSAIVIFSQAAR
jgi:hypothetical protein